MYVVGRVPIAVLRLNRNSFRHYMQLFYHSIKKIVIDGVYYIGSCID